MHGINPQWMAWQTSYQGIDQIPEGCLDYVIVLIQIPGGFSLAYDLEGVHS